MVNKKKQTINKRNVLVVSIFVILVIIALILFLSDMISGSIKNYPIGDNGVNMTPTSNNPDGVIGRIRNAVISLRAVDTEKIYSVGDSASFTVNVDNKENYILAVDTIINYSEEQAKVTKIENSNAFDAYPLSLSKDNKILISAIMMPGSSINQAQKLATVTVQFLKPGKAEFNVEFKPLQTVDSNVIASGNGDDVLGKVINVSFDVK